ncbi:uncharacterized protein LOC123315455 [Coccinella septempunctata]|uniref:uncharacterized protein LOC123315455 n=1 Tax=Coccinella septempunctata TaxID=41139 RepID=UPI001D08071B|nr:uncharacterized protein LOC123315455 [Coccinella septempunctata]
MGILLLIGNRMLGFFQKLQRNKPDSMDDVVRKFEKFSATYYKTAFFMCLVYGLDNTFKESNCALKDMIDGNSTLICGSQIPMLFPMGLSHSVPSFVKILNWFVLMYYFPSCLTVPALGLGSIELIVARIKHLKKMLKRFSFEEEINVALAKSHMRNCIIYFLDIKSLAAEMNNSVSLLFLPQYTVMSTILALLEYQMIVEFNAATVIRFTGWAFMEFMICMKCQTLLNESLDLAECVYDIEWYNMPQEVRSMYKIFHLAAQKPIHFQAKPFVPLDTKFLMNVMKSSYSLMMFFRTWSDEI